MEAEQMSPSGVQQQCGAMSKKWDDIPRRKDRRKIVSTSLGMVRSPAMHEGFRKELFTVERSPGTPIDVAMSGSSSSDSSDEELIRAEERRRRRNGRKTKSKSRDSLVHHEQATGSAMTLPASSKPSAASGDLSCSTLPSAFSADDAGALTTMRKKKRSSAENVSQQQQQATPGARQAQPSSGMDRRRRSSGGRVPAFEAPPAATVRHEDTTEDSTEDGMTGSVMARERQGGQPRMMPDRTTEFGKKPYDTAISEFRFDRAIPPDGCRVCRGRHLAVFQNVFSIRVPTRSEEDS
jgi:hypothetical protein